jgi:hypothetical protein
MKLRSKLFYTYVAFVVIYALATLLPAPSAITLAHYHISALGMRLLDVTIIIILAAIWYVGFYGYAKLRAYSQLIGNTKDGKQVAKFATGLGFIVFWLPVSSVSAALLNYWASKHQGLLPAVAIINNYVSLFFPFVGFAFISRGARGLSELVKQRPTQWAVNLIAVFLVYTGLIDYHLVASTADRPAIYHMSLWLIMTTLVAPYICMWFIGLLATYEIFNYRLKAPGVLYRDSWRLLALGLGWLVSVSIGFQYLTTVLSRLSNLSIYWIVAIIYSLLLVLSVGFVLIALGSRKLQRLEEV